MRLAVRHVTTYTYAVPRRRVLQSLRLNPSVFDGQRVVDWAITAPGAVLGAEFRDGAGDLTLTASHRRPVERIEIAVEGQVETQDLAGVLRGHRERVPPMVYFADRRVVRPDKALRDLARDAVKGLAEGATLDRAHALSAAVADAVAYRPGTSDAETTAAEALAQGSGVCQDHAHVLIAAAQVLSIPARYVAGYLHSGTGPAGGQVQVQAQGGDDDGQGQARQSQAQQGRSTDDAAGPAGDEPAVGGDEAGAEGASHAWAELHVEGLGWVGFDAANRCCPDARYIRLCSGFDADDAAPIRGLATAADGGAELDVSVDVAAIRP